MTQTIIITWSQIWNARNVERKQNLTTDLLLQNTQKLIKFKENQNENESRIYCIA